MAAPLLMFCFLLLAVVCSSTAAPTALPKPVQLEQKIVEEIQSYQSIADDIINYSLHGPGENQSYNRLALFTDMFGSRISGSENLENAIDYMLVQLEKDGQQNVHGEVANVTNWKRNTEFARLVEPRNYSIAITGLGSSVGTPEEGILADAIVVRSFDDLEQKSQEVSGKIVIFNQAFVSYENTAAYRVIGASSAAKYGAVATLIRSVTPFSIHRFLSTCVPK